MTDAKKLILFEPWSMGDALIAAAIALQDPTRLALACNSRWHVLLRAAMEGIAAPELITADLKYVDRGRTGRWDPGPCASHLGISDERGNDTWRPQRLPCCQKDVSRRVDPFVRLVRLRRAPLCAA